MMQTFSHLMRGVLDLVSPSIAMNPGRLIGGQNYEPEARGYRRVFGYERYDGQPKPSKASYWVLGFDAGSAAISEGDTVTGATSGATGKALIDAVVTSGSYGGGDAAGYIVLTVVSGAFADDENLQVSAVTKCVADGTAVENGATNDTDNQTWLADATATARALIAKVPGSGPVRGIFVLNGVVHAIRDNAGATAGVLHKASASGWQAQDLGKYIAFDAGTTEFLIGETLTGGTSGATATIQRVAILSGVWDGSATGILTLSGITGTFQDNETITSASGSATSNGTVVTNALSAGGRYDYTVNNFYGSAFSERAYAVNGIDRGFEWDGTYFTPIFTGLSDALDKPTRVSHYSNHLFLGYATGELINSELGEPIQYRTSGGAVTYSFGSPITNMTKGESTAIIIFGDDQIKYIAGDDADNFVMRDISHDAGAEAWTVVVAGSPTYMDQAGIRRITSTQAFGNWKAGTLTQQVEPLFQKKRAAGAAPRTAARVRNKDQYRLFFDDGTGITLFLGTKVPEIIPFALDHVAYTSAEGRIAGESLESTFIGTDDGYVMEIDRGTSFDGESIFAWLRFAFNHLGAPMQNKRFHKVTLECDSGPSTALALVGEYSHGSPFQPIATEKDLTVNAGGGIWDDTLWNDFYWSSQLIGEANSYIDGFGHNACYTIISDTATEQPHILKAITLHFSARGLRK